jgi:imidazolonepropionase-like amidohydrolase
MKSLDVTLLLFSWAGAVLAQSDNAQQSLVREPSALIAITHVVLIDGTGAAAKPDQTVILHDGRIENLGASTTLAPPAGARVIDGTGHTLIPGLVGMHEHLFYTSPAPKPGLFLIEQPFSFPLLYLASGVTTARTAGAIEPYTDLELKRKIDTHQAIGPALELTGPYLEGSPSLLEQMHALSGPQEAREFVRYWHSVGFSSLKAYMGISPEELKAAIEEGHSLGMKVTAHLCSVSFREAAEMGIDNLEHGPFIAPDSELYSKRKQPGSCMPFLQDAYKELAVSVDPNGSAVQQTIHSLIEHHVAITSTLAVVEEGSRPPILHELTGRAYMLMSPASWSYVMTARSLEQSGDSQSQSTLKKEMQFERAFVQAGGRLVAGCDPTGDGHTLAGLGDQRELELLVEAGFSVPEAVKIYTLNAAELLGKERQIGSITLGKQADLVFLKGDLAHDVNVIEKPELVFKNGVGYDSERIYESVRGFVGLR